MYGLHLHAQYQYITCFILVPSDFLCTYAYFYKLRILQIITLLLFASSFLKVTGYMVYIRIFDKITLKNACVEGKI